MPIISKKICIIGDSDVGKRSLIRRFVEHKFSDDYLSTVGVTISRKTLEFPGAKPHTTLNLNLLIWDITGHTKFQAIASSYLRGSSGTIVVADVSRPKTIERLSEHIQLFLSVNPKGSIVVALNKSDLIDEEKLEKLEKLLQLKDWEGVAGIYPTSAKTGLYVDEIFQQLAYRILESWDNSYQTLQLPPAREDFSDFPLTGDSSEGKKRVEDR